MKESGQTAGFDLSIYQEAILGIGFLSHSRLTHSQLEHLLSRPFRFWTYSGWTKSCTTWKPCLKPFVCWYWQGNRIILGLLRWCKMDFFHTQTLRSPRMIRFPCQYQQTNGFNRGFKVVRNGFRPSTVLRTMCRSHAKGAPASHQPPASSHQGFGFVCFSSPDEATKAVTEMHLKATSSLRLFHGCGGQSRFGIPFWLGIGEYSPPIGPSLVVGLNRRFTGGEPIWILKSPRPNESKKHLEIRVANGLPWFPLVFLRFPLVVFGFPPVSRGFWGISSGFPQGRLGATPQCHVDCLRLRGSSCKFF